MATWTGGDKIHSSRKPPQNEEGWHQPVKDEDYWFKDANKDQFGYGTEQEDPIIDRIKSDFGDEYGSDISMWVIQHYKDTGEYIKPENITDEIILKLKDKYPNY